MATNRISAWISALSIAISIPIISPAATNAGGPDGITKLIEYGWDTPDPAYIVQHIATMVQLPFNGIVFHLPHWPTSGKIFSKKPWADRDYNQALEDCKRIQWGKFTDNFIALQAASDLDWFDDTGWKAVVHNLRIVVKAAALARCRGICFDPEPYGHDPWRYADQAQAKRRTFIEYANEARKRGQTFMRVIRQQIPNPVILALTLYSIHSTLIEDTDVKRRDQLMKTHQYGLYAPFINGLLDEAGPGTIFVDGNEWAYKYSCDAQFYHSYVRIRRDATSLVDPDNISKYESEVQVGQAIFMDYIFGLGQYGVDANRSPAAKMTKLQRKRWFADNCAAAAHCSDRYVWIYSEKMNWWTGNGVPNGAINILQSAFHGFESQPSKAFSP